MPGGMLGERLEAALAVTLCVGALLWSGSARAPATLVLAAGAVVALALAATRARRRGRRLAVAPLALPLAASGMVALLQCLPLPHTVRALLSPASERVAEALLAGLGDGARPLAVDGAAALHGALRAWSLAALAIAFGDLGLRQRSSLRVAVGASLAALCLCATLSVLGIALPEPLAPALPSRALASFPLVNPNHAAALLALGLPLMLRSALDGQGRWRVAAAVLVLAGNLALVATLSRAGIVIGVLAQAALLVAAYRRRASLAGRLGAAVGVVLALAMALAARPLVARLGGGAGSGRLGIWADALPLIGDHALVGVGPGGFPLVYTRYASRSAQNRFAFVENEYLQVAIDGGLVGAVAVLVGMGAAFIWAVRALQGGRGEWWSAAIGLGALALANTVDFGWEMGAVAAAACAVAAIALPRAGPEAPRGTIAALGALVVALALLAASPLGRTVDQDGERLERALAAAPTAAAVVEAAVPIWRRHLRDPHLAVAIATRLYALGDPGSFVWLDRALLVAPHDVGAHRLLARALAHAGIHGQAAEELRGIGGLLPPDVLASEAIALFADRDDAALWTALGGERAAFEQALVRLRASHRLPLVGRLSQQALAADPKDVLALGGAVEAALAADEATRSKMGASTLVSLAERLAEVDPSPAATLMVADALVLAGQPEAALTRLLSAAGRDGPRDGRIFNRLVDLALARGELDRAGRVLDDALARALSVEDKAGLHLLRARLEDAAGRPHRAAFERAEAARLSRH